MMKKIVSNPLSAFLSPCSPEIQSIIIGLRQMIMSALPDATEQVDHPSKIIAYGYGKKYADLICAIAPFKDHVNLMFSKGVDLPDPAGLLEGTGKHARHIRFDSVRSIRNKAVPILLEASLNLAK